MYLEHYGLDEPPFRITPHVDFFFSGAKRGATLEALLYAITHDEGIIKISGEVGSGKTMLCRVLMERLPGQVVIVYLANPSLSREDILFALADELGITLEAGSRTNTVMRALQQKLVELYAENKQVVALIDEAHAMPKETLEEIRLLSNLESNRHKLLQLVLFGQPELDTTLTRSDMRQLRDRITHSFALEPLVRADIAAYLDFRMRAAGYRGPDVFTTEAVRLIEKASQGLTRRINILADKALLASFAAGTHQVGAKEAQAAIRDAEFTGSASTLPSPKRLAGPSHLLWAAGGAAIALAVVALWNFVGRTPTSVLPAAVPPPEPSPTSSQALPLSNTAIPATPPVSPDNKAVPSSPTPLLDRMLDESRPWLDSTANNRWFLQLFRSHEGASPEQVEHFLGAIQNIGLDSSQLRAYRSNIGGMVRFGVIYGDYASRQEAARAQNSLPVELKSYRPYPREVIRLRPN